MAWDAAANSRARNWLTRLFGVTPATKRPVAHPYRLVDLGLYLCSYRLTPPNTNTDQPRAGTREDLLRALDARSLADQIHQQGRQVATEFIQGRHLLQEDAQRPPPGP